MVWGSRSTPGKEQFKFYQQYNDRQCRSLFVRNGENLSTFDKHLLYKEVKFAANKGTCIWGKKVLGPSTLIFPIHDRTKLDYKNGN